uniref:Uncharacterized protein n=1 Tax=Rhizophora mucronata TaxID=61149 RepID=A0A2P2QKG6_RHIMU
MNQNTRSLRKGFYIIIDLIIDM